MGTVGKVARRTFLFGTLAVAGGVGYGYWRFQRPYRNPLKQMSDPGQAVLTPYVRIGQDGVTIITPRAEMGQGVHTTLAALVAEELDLELSDVRVEHGPASHAYWNGAVLEEGLPFAATDQSWPAEVARQLAHVPAKFIGMQVTGGSSSVPDAFDKMRLAGAAARAMLVEAAAYEWDVSALSLRTEGGEVVSRDGKRLSYIELAPKTLNIEPPAEPPLRHPSEWRILGKSQDRVDMVAKCTGTAEFGVDVRREDMLFATVRLNPHRAGLIRRLDTSRAEKMRGVERVVDLGYGIAVVATNTWYAMEAARAVEIEWERGALPATIDEHWKAVEAAFGQEDLEDSVLRDDGDAPNVLTPDDMSISYRAPYLAHATMEPMNATAWLRNGELDVWAGNQNTTMARTMAAQAAGLDEESVRIHTPYLGGGFGRRGELDFVTIATRVAVAMDGRPVKTTWSREEDMTQDFYRPLAMARVRARMADGKPEVLDVQLASPSPTRSMLGRLDFPTGGPDSAIVQAAWDQPYAIPNFRVAGYAVPELLPVSFWRSVGASQNAFFMESALDEMAAEANIDPIEMRLGLLYHEPSKKVLEAVKRMCDWQGGRLGEGRGRGVAFSLSFGVPIAEVVEVQVVDDAVRVTELWAAADVGKALDPRNVEAQVTSGAIFGLSAAMFNEITLTDGAVDQSNFDDYPVMRINQAPKMSVVVLGNQERVRGIGEPGTPPAAPALANAIYAATGRRLREMPFNKFVEFV